MNILISYLVLDNYVSYTIIFNVIEDIYDLKKLFSFKSLDC